MRPLSSSRSICYAANISAQDIGAKFIVVFTESGFTGQIISKYRPKVPVLALTGNDKTFQKMALFWGVIPSLIPERFDITHSLDVLEDHLKNNNLANAGDKIIIIAGSSSEEGGTNMMRLHRLL